MLRDVFYYGKKPNVHPREKFASSLEDARQQSTTEHFWIINEFCDYTNFDWDFDFEFLPDEDVWAEEHNNVWPSQHQKDSGTWLCPSTRSDVIVYRADVDPLKRKNELSDNWILLDKVDTTKFDFSWHPDPTDPPYIYRWGCKFFPVELYCCLEYRVPGATEIKYTDQTVELLPNWDLIVENQKVNYNKWDMSWRPDPRDPPYTYIWGNKHINGSLRSTLEYHVPGATEKKYMPDLLSVEPEWERWNIIENILKDRFDFTWRPDPREPDFIYVFGNDQYDGTVMPTIEYHMPGATERKHVTDIHAILAPSPKNFQHLEDSYLEDYSWHPDPKSPPYIYAWGNQWNIPEDKISVQYVVKGATEYKYMSERAIRRPCMDNWEIPDNIDTSGFDFSWEPSPKDPPYIYQFGTQWQKTGGPRYVVKGATEVKYVDVIKAESLPNRNNWVIPEELDIAEFDFSWHPDATESAYVYQFGTKWAMLGGPVYMMPGASEVKYIDFPVAKTKPDKTHWFIPNDIAEEEFDFSWHPYLDDQPYIYQFGTQWQKTGGPRYLTPGSNSSSPVKYVDTQIIKARKLPQPEKFEIQNDFKIDSFDYSWHPDETEPPYNYCFGNTEYGPEVMPTIIYRMPDATQTKYVHDVVAIRISVNQYYIETTLTDLVNDHPDEVFWALRKNIDYTHFDFKWRPQLVDYKWDSRYVSVFGSADSEITHTYFVNANSYLSGNTEFKFIKDEKLETEYLTELFVKPDIFFIDTGNRESKDRFEELQQRFGKRIQKTRYSNSWVETINRCTNRSTTDLCWILNSELDYTTFNFDYYPNPWQMKMIHVFGTQWSHWGTTYLINTETFANDTKYVKVIEHLPNLNFVKTIKARATNCLYNVYLIDFKNHNTELQKDILKQKSLGKSLITVNYQNNYFDTLRYIVDNLIDSFDKFIWVCSTICNNESLDFSYICDPFSQEQLHVFPSNNQKYGDTFLINVKKFKDHASSMAALVDYPKINFNYSMRVKRLPAPEFVTGETHISYMQDDYDFPYAIYKTEDNKNIAVVDEEPISLWQESDKNIKIYSKGGTVISAPKEVKSKITKELYDYPYVSKSNRILKSKRMDVVFVSNNETNAEKRYELLCQTLGYAPKWVNGVTGRETALKKAASLSDTDWVLVIPGKLEISKAFDFDWQPDRLQEPKHYIFYATNPVNKLCYGHMAPVMYNKRLVLETEQYGIDFTLSKLHQVIPVTAGIARYNLDPLMTWRTAFREAIKLKLNDDVESTERLDTWLHEGEGLNAEYSKFGAVDGVDYFNLVQGNNEELMKTFRWDWLENYFTKKYKNEQ